MGSRGESVCWAAEWGGGPGVVAGRLGKRAKRGGGQSGRRAMDLWSKELSERT